MKDFNFEERTELRSRNTNLQSKPTDRYLVGIPEYSFSVQLLLSRVF
jgi:hypothetical protein